MPPGAASAARIAQDEILTGEAVALDVQPVGFLLRAVGAAIDMAVGILLIIAALVTTTFLVGEGVVPVEAIGIVSIAAIVLVLVVVPTAVETASRGRSLGKLAVGGRIVRVDGGASGFRQAFLRALVGVLELWFTLGGLAAIVAAFTPRSERLGDLLAGTYAERTRTPKLPPETLAVPVALAGWAAVADVGRLPDRVSRRVAQYVRGADRLDPGIRARFARELAVEVAPFVSPVPTVDPHLFLTAVAALRRDREYRALLLEDSRVEALIRGATGAPRGFPER